MSALFKRTRDPVRPASNLSRLGQRQSSDPRDAHKVGITLQRRLVVTLTIIMLTALTVGLGQPVAAQETAQFFKLNCGSCHWIGGGRLIGPDLKNVTERKERDWLTRFILDPQGVLASGDPYALKLKAEAKGAIMINVVGMTRQRAEALLDLIEAESQLDSSQFAGKIAPTGPYSEADAKVGSELFTGSKSLTGGGPPCISCHFVNVARGNLGGKLGPDLSDVFTRMQGRNALTAWLAAPPTPTMQTVFANRNLDENEINYMVAYLESVTGKTNTNYETLIVWLGVIFCGLGGSFCGLVVFSGIWSKRYRAVRRPLIERSQTRGEL